MRKREIEAPLRLAAKLVATAPDLDTKALALALAIRLRLPMNIILAKIEGEAVADKCRAVGCSRNTWYAWMRGEFRPQGEHAHRIAQLTEFSVSEVMGLPQTE